MKISRITNAESIEYELRDPVTNEPLGAFFTIAGPEHPKRRELAFEVTRKLRARVSRTGNAREALEDPQEEFEAQAEQLATVVLGWRGMEYDDGSPLEYSRDTAVALFSDARTAWIRDQVKEAANKAELFIRRSANA